MSNSFIPLENTNIAIIDGRASEEKIKKLEDLNIKVIKSIKCHELQEGIAYHPDMVIHPINHKMVIVAPNVFDYYEDLLSDMGIIVLKGETRLSSQYPNDIVYNVARLNNYAIHNFNYTDDKLKWYLEKEKLELIHVKQGYSKCSLAVVDEISGITSDKMIYEILSKKGMEVLLIKAGQIKIDGYEYGFIGGATGSYSKTHMIFTGSLDKHPDYEEIKLFLKKRNIEIIYLSTNEVIDLGTIITLNNC